MYSNILQPEAWAQWVRNKVDSFVEGTVTNYQDFMNSAVMKYNQIVGRDGDIGGSTTIVQADSVPMLSKSSRRKRKEDDDGDTFPKKRSRPEPPPFSKHFKSSSGNKYKAGDTKDYNGVTFCFFMRPQIRTA